MHEARRVISVRGTIVSVAMAALIGGCGVVANNVMHEPAVLNSLQVSDAITGQTGIVRIQFSNPVQQDTTVTLTSSHTAVVTVPASVTILAGGLSADVQYMGVAPGSAEITATSGMDTQTASVQVVGALIVNGPFTQNIEVGAVAPVEVDVNIRVGAPLNVMLTSSNTSVATVDAMITIPAFSQVVQGQVTGVAQGAATLTATAAGYVASTTVSVVAKAQLNQIYLSGSLLPGTTGYGYAYLNAIPRSGGTISLASTSSVIMVPPTVSVSNSSYIPFAITAGNMSGTSTISATFNGFTLSTIAFVGNPSNTNFLRFNSLFANTSTLEVGAATLIFAEFGPTSQSDDSGQIMFSSAGVLSTPSTSLVIPANFGQVSFPVTGVAIGTTNVVVTVEGQQLATTITVKAPVFSLTPAGTLAPNHTETLVISSDALLAADRQWTLSSSNPSVAQVSSASVTAGAGSFGTSFGLKGIAPGTSMITATNGSTMLTTSVTVM